MGREAVFVPCGEVPMWSWMFASARPRRLRRLHDASANNGLLIFVPPVRAWVFVTSPVALSFAHRLLLRRMRNVGPLNDPALGIEGRPRIHALPRDAAALLSEIPLDRLPRYLT